MRRKIVYGVVAVFISLNVCVATIILPLPFEKQVEEATSAVEVKLANSRVFKNNSGITMTEYSFDVMESYNLSNDDLENQQLKLAMPGGTYDGMTSMVDGAPVFRKDERSFLLLKKIESQIYLSNFSLGKYKVEVHEGKSYYVSEVFPTDHTIGKISKDEMLQLMHDKWKISYRIPQKIIIPQNVSFVADKPFIKSIIDIERRPAEEAIIHDEGIPLFFWSAIAFFLFFFFLIFFKLGKSGQTNKNN